MVVVWRVAPRPHASPRGGWWQGVACVCARVGACGSGARRRSRLAGLARRPHSFSPCPTLSHPQGYITSPGGPTPAVLAIYSDARVLQLVAFSANAAASLITLLGRRPDKAHYYRAHHLPTVDRDAMVAVREAWFVEHGGAPVGNKREWGGGGGKFCGPGFRGDSWQTSFFGTVREHYRSFPPHSKNFPSPPSPSLTRARSLDPTLVCGRYLGAWAPRSGRAAGGGDTGGSPRARLCRRLGR